VVPAFVVARGSNVASSTSANTTESREAVARRSGRRLDRWSVPKAETGGCEDLGAGGRVGMSQPLLPRARPYAGQLEPASVVSWKSTDGGKTFKAFRGAPGGDDYHRIWINPNDTKTMIIASDQGAIVTVNGGESWSSWYNQPTGQFYRLATDDRFPYWIYSGQQDSGTVAIASRSDICRVAKKILSRSSTNIVVTSSLFVSEAKAPVWSR